MASNKTPEQELPDSSSSSVEIGATASDRETDNTTRDVLSLDPPDGAEYTGNHAQTTWDVKRDAKREFSNTVDISELDLGGYTVGASRGIERISIIPSDGYPPRTGTKSLGEVSRMNFSQVTSEDIAGKPDRMKVVITVVVIIAIVAVAFFAKSQMDLRASSTESLSNASSPATSPNGDASSVSRDGVVKASLADYSWNELSEIADEISGAISTDDAERIAISYNLLKDDGTIDASQIKVVELAGGVMAEVHLVDIYHDPKSNGLGKAGLTFLFSQCVANRPMNSGEYNSGGWEASEARSWLNSDFYNKLPSELRTVIVSVDKETNNEGETTSLDTVTNTSDKLWLLSLCEVAGQIDVINDHDNADNNDYNRILKAEGSQYRFFSDADIRSHESNRATKRVYDDSKVTWWLRSPSPGDKRLFRAVSENGNPSKYGIADRNHGIAPGFCL